MTDLILHFKNLIPQELIFKLSTVFNERECQLKQAIEVSISSVLLGVKKCKSLDVLLRQVKDSEVSYEKELEFFFRKEAVFSEAHYFINHLFPSKKDRISEMISNEICIKSESSRAVFNLVTLLVLTNLKEGTSERLVSIQETELQTFCRFLPVGVRLILGVSASENAYVYSELSETVAFGFSFFGFKKK